MLDLSHSIPKLCPATIHTYTLCFSRTICVLSFFQEFSVLVGYLSPFCDDSISFFRHPDTFFQIMRCEYPQFSDALAKKGRKDNGYGYG